MNILSWLKKLLIKIFKIDEKDLGQKSQTAPSTSSATSSAPVPSEGIPVSNKAGSSKTDETANFWTTLQELKKNVQQAKDDARDTLNDAKDTRALAAFGFFALFFITISLVYGYWQFVYDSTKKDDYKYNLTDKINDQKIEIVNLKQRIESLEKDNKKLLDEINCLQNKKYWQYQQCFNNL